MIDPVIMSGGIVLGLYLLQPKKGTPASAGDAITAAMTELLSRRGFYLPNWNPDDEVKYSAAANYNLMRAAFVAKYGAAPGTPTGAPLPDGLDSGDLSGLATAWLAAYDAGRAANPANFGLIPNERGGTFDPQGLTIGSISTCGNATSLTSLGQAACALSKYRDQLDAAPSFATAETGTQETFRLVNALAAEMDGADFVTPGVRNTEQGWQWGNVPGAVEAAAVESGKFVLGKGGDLVGWILDRDVVWLAALGVVGYLVLTRAA